MSNRQQKPAQASGTGRKQKREALLKCTFNMDTWLLERSKTMLPIPGTASR